MSETLVQTAITLAANDPRALRKIVEQLDADVETFPTMAEAAHNYAAQGILVFPLVPGEKRPAVRRGLHDASTDPDQVRDWWTRNPHANIGIRTGELFDVIDIDGHPGYMSLDKLRRDNAPTLNTIIGTASTSRLGKHLYVPPAHRGNKAGVLPGIDYRGRGGYVVAPPSISAATGRRWVWLQPLNLGKAAAA